MVGQLRYVELAASLPGVDMCYAVKANPAPEILEMLVDLGASFDVASPPEVDACLAAGADPRSGKNSTGHTGWTPPCPPEGDKPHRYEFSLYALPKPSGLVAGAEPAEVRAALAGALARGRFTATFGR